MASFEAIRRMKAALAVTTLAAIVAMAPDASAIERQHHVGLDPTLALLKIDDKSTLSTGVGLGVHYTYGLTDQFNLMVDGNVAFVAGNQQPDEPSTPHTRPSQVDYLTAGVGYVLDIVQWVPYFGLAVGGYRLAGGTLDNAEVLPGAAVALGLDYQLSRSWAVGVGFRQHLLFTKLSTYPSYTTAFLRFEYVWGW